MITECCTFSLRMIHDIYWISWALINLGVGFLYYVWAWKKNSGLFWVYFIFQNLWIVVNVNIYIYFILCVAHYNSILSFIFQPKTLIFQSLLLFIPLLITPFLSLLFTFSKKSAFSWGQGPGQPLFTVSITLPSAVWITFTSSQWRRKLEETIWQDTVSFHRSGQG